MGRDSPTSWDLVDILSVLKECVEEMVNSMERLIKSIRLISEASGDKYSKAQELMKNLNNVEILDQ
ncbi:hypothetical protein SLEP1_g28085 [Rubroshorea leprosula]|uniref:Uncharacterized protein n=1 Tax=Rubroshorea leprosula TaxID=152421 RepID=A0AAV5K509_9ROSI|nr:hypothetical protein SLEP1_g28085 [Rubroshorea leprosula]